MKKLFPIILLLVVVIVGWLTFKDGNSLLQSSNTSTSQGTETGATGGSNPENTNSTSGSLQLSPTGNISDDEFVEEEIRPATEVYKSADEAMAALSEAAEDYDDLVLEQFAELGDDCSWCPEVYERVQAKLYSQDTTEDEKSYYAEVLAISGTVENVEFLIDAIEAAPDPDMADIFTEALEITYGDEKVVSYLGDKLSTEDEVLRESVVAALTNHGSTQALDILYNQTVKANDPDGYYSLGIGLGEVIPDDDAIPYLVDIAKKRDQYSHLAIKALLNNGNEGLKVVMDIIAATDDPATSEKLLTDAIDHVPYEEDTEEYLNKVIETTKSPVVKDFAKEILQDFDDLEGDEF